MIVKNVLIVESTDNMRLAMMRMFREMGVEEIFQANNGEIALSVVEKQKVDLIVSEWRLPKLSGKDLLLAIRKNTNTKDIPFIICTSSVDQLTVTEALKCGVSQFIAKPFNYKMLKERVNSALQKPLNGTFNHHKKTDKPVTEKQSANESKNVSNGMNVHAEIMNTSEHLLQAQEKLTILVVDDEINNIEIATKCIKPLARVKFALSGSKALQLCKSSPPDLILLDIMMPEMDGYQVFNAIKNDVTLLNIPIIFLTAKAEDDDIIKGLELGADDYITKPFNMKILQMRVQNQLNVVKYNQSLDRQINEHIMQFRMKENVDRILFQYIANPLNQINESTERISKKALTSKQLKRETDSIELASRNINQIITSLATILDIESKSIKPKFEAVHLHDLITDVMKLYSREQHANSIQVDNYISTDSRVFGDPQLFITLFTEAYVNAIEATPRGASIAFFESVKEDEIEITIFNSSAVAESIRETFFEKYVSYGKKFGTGLGTYAIKLICELCHGRAELECKDNETRVILTFKKA